MADTKISALPASTTPLAGTETLPIVQGGVTKQVSVANLTAGRAVAMAGGSFTNDITQSTAAKGVDFAANTPAAGMTSRLLNWYEEGNWTPTQGAGVTVVGTYSSSAKYVRVGKQVTVTGFLAGSTSIACAAPAALLSGLPFVADFSNGYQCGNATDYATSAGYPIYSYNLTLYAITAIAATPFIYFSITYLTV